ncbi:hypothetical protein D9M72_466930 [compost metagenome]
MVLGALAVVDDEFQLALELRIHGPVVRRDLLFGEQARLDAEGKVHFLFSVQQGNLADLLQVVLDGVGGGAGRHDLLDRGVVVIGIGIHEAGAGGGSAGLAGGFLLGQLRWIRSHVVQIFIQFDVLCIVVVRRARLAGGLSGSLGAGLGSTLFGLGLRRGAALGGSSIFDSLIGCTRGGTLGARRRLLLLRGQFGLVGGFLLRGRRGHRKPF